MISVQVRRDRIDQHRVMRAETPAPGEGEVLFRIERFALTANNVTYAVAGEMVGYWKFFPVAEPEGATWGVTPVWGFATAEVSRHPDIKAGERIWGFLPMASHVVMKPGGVSAKAFVDAAAHRAGLPPIYNGYQRVDGDPPEMQALADARCLFFPLFSTSYLLYDYLADNAFFGAEQVIVSGASSKTGYGLCNMLKRHEGARPQVVGLTSRGNVGFVEEAGSCDAIVTYDALDRLDATKPAAFVDMAGNGAVVEAIHARFGDRLKLSCAVGLTHWKTDRFRGGPGETPHDFFFAPAQFIKREKDWGAGEPLRRATRESARMAVELMKRVKIRRVEGADDVLAAFAELAANKVPPDTAIMASIPE